MDSHELIGVHYIKQSGNGGFIRHCSNRNISLQFASAQGSRLVLSFETLHSPRFSNSSLNKNVSFIKSLEMSATAHRSAAQVEDDVADMVDTGGPLMISKLEVILST